MTIRTAVLSILLGLFLFGCDQQPMSDVPSDTAPPVDAPPVTASVTPTVVMLPPSADAYIRTDLNVRRNDNYGCQDFGALGTSRGGGGRPFGGADAQRMLLRFDLSGTPATTLLDATLELTVHSFDNGTSSSVYQVDVHRIIASGPRTPFVEGNGYEGPIPPGCTGTDPAFGVAWAGTDANNQTQPDFDPTIVARELIPQTGTSLGDAFQWDVTSLVQDWLDGTSTNYGILLRDVTSQGSVFRAIRFGTKEGIQFGIPGAVTPARLILKFAVAVSVDIKPGSDRNPINTRSRGVVPVAILGTPSFDVTHVDVATLRFGPAEASAEHGGHLEDVNNDGQTDLVLHFRQQDTGIGSGDEEACLFGTTTGAAPIEGCDAIAVVR